MTSNPLSTALSNPSPTIQALDNRLLSVGSDQTNTLIAPDHKSLFSRDNTLYHFGGDQYFNQVFPPLQGPAHALRPVNNIPINIPSVHYIGRESEIDFLRNALSKTQGDVPSCCAVYGMPGVGKSQLVSRYAKISFDHGQYSYIFWISAANVGKLKGGLANVLDLICHPDRHLKEQYAKLTAARLWLEEVQDNWLLIFDNVDRSSIVFFRTHLPRRNVRGNILFTTRTEDVATALATIEGIQHSTFKLHPLDLHDSLDLLLRDGGVDMTTVTPSLIRAEELVQSVGRLPLAIVQAASFMRQTHTTLDEMCDMYMGNEKIHIFEWENVLTPYQHRSVAATFTRRFKELQRESGDIANLFKILSFLDPESISLSMITRGAKEWLHPQHPLEDVPAQPEHDSRIFLEFHSLVTLICSMPQFRTAVQKLKASSLVEYHDSSLQMNDLIRFIRHEGAKKEDAYREWLRSSVSLICGALRQIRDPESPDQWAECEEFVPHLQSLNRWWGNEYGTDLELIDSNARMALYSGSRGRYDAAESWWKPVLEAYETKFGREHPSTLMSMTRLAIVYQSQGRFYDAEILHKQVLVEKEKHLGADHPDTLTSLDNLAIVYQSQGRHDEAESLHERVLAGRETCLGIHHPDTLTSMHNLAAFYQSQGRFNEAEAFFVRALVGREEYLGTHHPDTLTSLDNLATVYQSQGRFNEAEALDKRAIAGREKHLGANPSSTLALVTSLIPEVPPEPVAHWISLFPLDEMVAPIPEYSPQPESLSLDIYTPDMPQPISPAAPRQIPLPLPGVDTPSIGVPLPSPDIHSPESPSRSPDKTTPHSDSSQQSTSLIPEVPPEPVSSRRASQTDT